MSQGKEVSKENMDVIELSCTLDSMKEMEGIKRKCGIHTKCKVDYSEHAVKTPTVCFHLCVITKEVCNDHLAF